MPADRAAEVQRLRAEGEELLTIIQNDAETGERPSTRDIKGVRDIVTALCALAREEPPAPRSVEQVAAALGWQHGHASGQFYGDFDGDRMAIDDELFTLLVRAAQAPEQP